MNAINQISFMVASDLLCLGEVLAKYEQIKPELIDQRLWLECQLALVEAFTNAVRHAHKNKPPETTIQIDITIDSSCIEIKIWDQGQAFILPSITQSPSLTHHNLQSGGRGIHILHKVADDLKYERQSDNRNCLVIRKNINQQP